VAQAAAQRSPRRQFVKRIRKKRIQQKQTRKANSKESQSDGSLGKISQH
jgi:hypothetical protein